MLVDMWENLQYEPQVPMHTTAVDRVDRGVVGFDALTELFEACVRRNTANFGGTSGKDSMSSLGDGTNEVMVRVHGVVHCVKVYPGKELLYVQG